ncbi:MAG TPA: four helix bundle protein [Bacillota bacterium]|nr:four helix bundle protein [Bacillota bacterium]
MRIKKFEDIEAWKVARSLTKDIYTVTSKGPFEKDYGLRDQIRRASVSIMSNIAEGYERDGNKEFKQFLSTAKGSAGEVKCQLYIAFDVGFITDDEYKALSEKVNLVSNLIGGFIRYLNESRLHGRKNS